MEYVRDGDGVVYAARSRELAFLANALVAGCSVQSRPFTPREASDAVVGICNLGLEYWPERWFEAGAASVTFAGGTLPLSFLADHDLVAAFEVGWTILHEDVCMFAADRLIATLSDLRCGDTHIQDELATLLIELNRQREAGTPWRACDALEVIAMLDMPAWISLLGLMAECPVLPAAVTATLHGRTGAVSASAFECFSTRRQLVMVRDFMARLPDILCR